MSNTFTMPMRSDHGAPRFDTSRPRELSRYFEDLELLLSKAAITVEADKKGYVAHYADFDTEQLWKSLPEFADNLKTYVDYKKAILEHYPDAAGDYLYSIRDMDLLIGERQRLGISSVKDLSDFHLPFLSITTWLINKSQLSTIEQDRAYTRAFQPQLLSTIVTQLRFQKPQHHPNIPHKVADVYSTARMVLQGMPSVGFASPTQPTPTIAVPVESPVKIESLGPLMAEFTKTIVEALKGNNLSPRTIERILDCIMCGGKHSIFNCDVVEEFIKAGKCKRNHENKVVLPNGSFVSRSVPGRYLRDRIEEWHNRNPGNITASTFVNTIQAIQALSSNTPRLTSSAYVLSNAERKAALKAELYNIEAEEQVQVSAVRTRAQQRTAPSNDDDEAAVSAARQEIPRIEEVPDVDDPPQQPTATTSNSQPSIPEHPYRHAKDAAYQPPVIRNVAAQDKANPAKRQEPAYKTLPPIHDPAIATNVYTRSMDAPITITQRELLSLSPEVRSQHRDATTTRRVHAAQHYLDSNNIEDVDTQLLDAITDTLQANSIEDSHHHRASPTGSITVPDPVEKYYKQMEENGPNDPKRLVTATETGAVRAISAVIDNHQKHECILDPGCQIVAMSENICHGLGLTYDPSIILNMQSANGNIDKSLGLSRNVPFRIGPITLYLQVHIVQSAAYDILLGRPFDVLTESVVRNFSNEDQTITICNPNNGQRVTVPTFKRTHKHRHCPHTEEDF
jgi:Protein of unknown function (DUF4100)/Aspartyl protease